MIDGKLIGEGSVEGLKLLNNLVELLKSAEEDGKRLAVADVIEKLPAEAFALAGQFIEEIEKLRVDFANIDPKREKTIDQLQSETSYWRVKTYRKLRNFRPKITAISGQLSMFFDDIVALSHCKEAEDLVAQSFAKSKERQDRLHSEADFNSQPVGVVLDKLLSHAKELRTELQRMMNRHSKTSPHG